MWQNNWHVKGIHHENPPLYFLRSALPSLAQDFRKREWKREKESATSAFVASVLLRIGFPLFQWKIKAPSGEALSTCDLWLALQRFFQRSLSVRRENPAGQTDPEGFKQRQMSDCWWFKSRFLWFCPVWFTSSNRCSHTWTTPSLGWSSFFYICFEMMTSVQSLIIKGALKKINEILPPVFLILLLFIPPQSLVHPETCKPEMSLTPAFWPPGFLPRVKSVSIGSHGSLCSPKRRGKRQYQETPQPQFWMASPLKHVTRSLCLPSMAVERASHWLERKRLIVSDLL